MSDVSTSPGGALEGPLFADGVKCEAQGTYPDRWLHVPYGNDQESAP